MHWIWQVNHDEIDKLNKVLGDFAEPQAHEASWNQFEHWTHRQLHQPKARSVFKGSIWLARQDIRCHPSTGSDTVDLHKRRGSLAMLQKLMEEMHLKRESMLFLWYQFAARPDLSLQKKKKNFWNEHVNVDVSNAIDMVKTVSHRIPRLSSFRASCGAKGSGKMLRGCIDSLETFWEAGHVLQVLQSDKFLR